MKILKRQLRRIIKEEIDRLMVPEDDKKHVISSFFAELLNQFEYEFENQGHHDRWRVKFWSDEEDYHGWSTEDDYDSGYSFKHEAQDALEEFYKMVPSGHGEYEVEEKMGYHGLEPAGHFGWMEATRTDILDSPLAQRLLQKGDY